MAPCIKIIFCFSAIAAFTALALFSVRDDSLCKGFIAMFAAVGIITAFWRRTENYINYIGTALMLVAAYLALIYSSYKLGSIPINTSYLRAVGPYLFLGLFAPVFYLEIRALDQKIWRGSFALLFAATALGIQAINIKWVNFQKLKVILPNASWDIWTEKYYIYWLILLIWGCVAFFSWKRKMDRLIIIAMHIATISLILASSRTAPRALAIYAGGLATYCMLTTMPVSKRGLKVMVWLIVIILFITPWLLNTFDVTKLDERVGDRTLVYQASYELVLQKPWLGYGFGSTLQLEHPKLPMPDYVHHSYPGGHPHNLALLFWLEYGASGALFLCIGVWLMLNRVVEQAHGRDTMPAIAALIVTFFIMVSFSWSVWYYSIILFYAMFAGLVLLLLNIDEPTRDDPRLCVMAPVG